MQLYPNQEIFNEVLACPFCKHPSALETYSQCPNCGKNYTQQDDGLLDLRLKEQIQRQITLKYPPKIENTPPTEVLRSKPNPEVDFQGLKMPLRMNSAMQSHFPKAPRAESIALDIGCEGTQHRCLCERAGYRYMGIDYSKVDFLPKNAPVLLGDAHALPIRDQSVDFVLMQSVLQYLSEPHLVFEEIHRVLKPQGVFVGSVSFLAPYDAGCHYQYSDVGIRHLLAAHGFEIEYLAASSSWTVLDALAQMKFFPKMPLSLARMIFFPIKLLHNLWWKLGSFILKNSEHDRHIRYFTGVFFFRARRKVAQG